jgi:hypothetical protein
MPTLHRQRQSFHLESQNGYDMENNGGDKQNSSTICVYMEISQRNPLNNYGILIKCFKNRLN